FRIKWPAMPANGQEENSPFERIKRGAVEARVELQPVDKNVQPLAEGSRKEANPVKRRCPFRDRRPTGEKHLVAVLHDMNLLAVADVLEQIVAVDRPAVERGGVVACNRAVVEQQGRPAQAMKDNAVLLWHAPPGGRNNGGEVGGIPLIAQGL